PKGPPMVGSRTYPKDDRGVGASAPTPLVSRHSAQLAGQLASMLLSMSSVLPPTIHAVASVQNVPDPTALGIMSAPSKRKMSEPANRAANDASSASVINDASMSFRGDNSECLLAISTAYSAEVAYKRASQVSGLSVPAASRSPAPSITLGSPAL